jgi:hypothetical protein
MNLTLFLSLWQRIPISIIGWHSFSVLGVNWKLFPQLVSVSFNNAAIYFAFKIKAQMESQNELEKIGDIPSAKW